MMEFGIYTDGILYNHKENRAYYFYLDKSRLSEIEEIAGTRSQVVNIVVLRHATSPEHDKATLCHENGQKAKSYVYDGDVFQVVLAKSMGLTLRATCMRFYESLREVNPVTPTCTC